MTISFYAEDIELPAIKKEAVSNWIRKVAETYGKKTGDISYIFCSDEKILEVNRQYLQHDYYTEQMQKSSKLHTTKNCIVPSSTESFIYAASTTKGQGRGRSWKKTKTKHWLFCRESAGRVNPGIFSFATNKLVWDMIYFTNSFSFPFNEPGPYPLHISCTVPSGEINT